MELFECVEADGALAQRGKSDRSGVIEGDVEFVRIKPAVPE